MQNKHQREFFIYLLQFWFLASLNKKLPKVLINHYQALYSTESAHPLMFTGGWNSLPLFLTFLLHYLPAIMSLLFFHFNLVQELSNYRLLFDLINMDLWQKPILRWKQCLKIPLCLGNGEWGGKTKEKSIILWFTISLAQLQVQLELGGGQLQPDHWLSDHLPKVTGLASHHCWFICDHYHHYFYRCFFRDKLCLWCFPFLRNEYLAHAEWFWWFWLIVSRWHSSVVVAWLGESTDKPRHWPEK